MSKAMMGRPRLPEDEARKVYPLRINKNERDAFQKAADAQQLSLPDWMRKILTEATKIT
jgi:predicted HicB family RNase H-like nuclease